MGCFGGGGGGGGGGWPRQRIITALSSFLDIPVMVFNHQELMLLVVYFRALFLVPFSS